MFAKVESGRMGPCMYRDSPDDPFSVNALAQVKVPTLPDAANAMVPTEEQELNPAAVHL